MVIIIHIILLSLTINTLVIQDIDLACSDSYICHSTACNQHPFHTKNYSSHSNYISKWGRQNPLFLWSYISGEDIYYPIITTNKSTNSTYKDTVWGKAERLWEIRCAGEIRFQRHDCKDDVWANSWTAG